MADDERDRDDDAEPWGEGPADPPLTEAENPLEDEDGERDDGWMPPIP